ncbi:MAG: hypothetical protein K2N63_04355 [Lachnospiraceae bacterium]|nr:hypothetical protein [Lachnospiraceae bacterium]
MYKINLYLETSIRGIRKSVGWYGYLLEWIDSKGQFRTLHGFKCEMAVTPNMLVLMAFCAALNRMNKDSEITVFTDSLYLRECYTQYLQAWKENGWKTAKGEPVKNLILWQQADKLTSRHAVRFSMEYHHSYKNWMVSEIVKRRDGNV